MLRQTTLVLLLLCGGCSLATRSPVATTAVAKLPAGTVQYDLYQPATRRPAPLVVIAHGFLRGREHMRGWGEHLAGQGFVVAIPTLPTLADHSRNGDAIVQLVEHLCGRPTTSPAAPAIDPSRVALMGYSSGGLSTFLAASRSPAIDLWIGLDPVDRRGLAVKAAPQVRCRVVKLMAEPADCNKDANWSAVKVADGLELASLVVTGSVHTDCESPTDGLVVIACGRPDPQRTQTFFEYATAALQAELLHDAAAAQRLADAGDDRRVHAPGAK
jgi:dienelactone hydrolase